MVLRLLQLAALACITSLSVALPPHLSFDNNSLLDNGSISTSPSLQARDDKPFYLRTAALGASITNGYLSSDGNGYRKYLRDELRLAGWPVNMVGSIKTGTMNDNDNEGHLGWITQQVTDTALPNIIPDQPNLVLINVGTNNAAQNNDVSTASDDYIELLEKLWAGIPDATVIISTLLPNKNSDTNARAETINDQLRTTVMSHYEAQNRKLILADMNDGFITQADLNDDTHPTDFGYKKMASVWWAAFQTVEQNGWLTAPAEIGVSDNTTTSDGYICTKVYGDGDGNYQIQKGSGTDDGNYVHSSEDQGIVWTSPYDVEGGDDNYGNNFFFAQLVNAGGNPIRGGEVDEIIWAHSVGDKWSWEFWINNNNNDFGEDISFDPGYECAPNASRFADLNNNGLDDYLCIDPLGNLWASLNRGGNPPVFEPAGIIGDAPDFWSDGYTVDLVHMADIDGDGRADWCILLHPGDIACLRNGGQGDLPTEEYDGFWQDFSTGTKDWTTVFPSQQRGNGAGVNLVDINGDFKTDWLFMTETGEVDTFINHRGTGDGMVPDWQYADVTHGGLASFNVTNANSAVKFGRMYGTGRRDYIWIQETAAELGSFGIALRIWKNLGSGGTYLKGDGSNYCDMDGDGQDDYIWVGPNGQIDIYLNDDNRPYWDNHLGVITLGVNRKTIHIADLDGDGRCDFLSVDRTSGAVRMWVNNWDSSTRTWTFVDHGIVSGSAGCTEGYGVIENDHGVRFADLTGDGKADYLCIEPNGRVTGYLNRGMTSSGQIAFEDVGQIKLATNYDRQNVRFNDVNGDGKADLLWINKYTGDTTVWYNAGEIPTSGSHFKWDIQGALYRGWDRGSNMNFGALGGQHRADIIQVIPRTNIAYISYNKCPYGGSGGDDPNMGDPGLPDYTSSNGCPSGICPQAIVTFPDTTCDATKQATIIQELQYTLDMASETQANLQRGEYYETFFSANLRQDGDFSSNTARVYGNIVSMLDGSSGYKVAVTCDGKSISCVKYKWYAHMNDNSKDKTGTINFCDTFWTEPRLQPTESILNSCPASTPDLRTVQRAYSSILLHEMTHTSYAMSYSEKTYDYAYGYNFCTQLAIGNFDRSCMKQESSDEEVTKSKILCPNAQGQEGVCNSKFSANNADTYSFVAAGIYFTTKCGTDIPLPAAASKFKHRAAIASRQSSCPVNNDYIFWDLVDPIDSYVHFGDSYGAGMGTGTTTGDKCRVGSNNFGKLIYSYMNDASIVYNEQVCSGDTLTGLTKQIDKWNTASSASIGTLSIGGNDVFFSDLVNYCVVALNLASPGSWNRQWCVDAENKAISYMSDTTTSGLQYKLKEAYLSILNKSGQDFFHLYVTSYVTFFNADTTDCDLSTFHYWWAQYNPPSDWFLNRIVYLTTALRTELNAIVTQLNSVIANAINDANNEHGTEQVHFIDVGPYFDNGNHRWCENPNGEFHEPDTSRDDTWFFLSAWKDVGIDGSADATAADEAAEAAAIFSAGQIPLPDSATCNTTLGTDPDPYDYAMCQVSISIAQDPTGLEAVRYQGALADIASKNYSSQDVPAYYPTRQIKTFHPRSPGMVAYRDAVLVAIVDVGQL